MLFMGVCSIVGGALALFLPETLGEPLVESISEVDNMGKDGKKFFSWWSTKEVEEHLNQKLQKANNA